MKKKIIVCAFSALILATIVFFTVMGIYSHFYDMNPDNNVDFLKGLGTFVALFMGGFCVLYEADLFYTTYYFFTQPKTITRTILNILANLSLVLAFVDVWLQSVIMELRKFENAPIILLQVYVVLRIVYIVISTIYSRR